VSLGTIPRDEKTNGKTNNAKCNDTKPQNLNDMTGMVLMKKTEITASMFNKNTYQIRFFIWLHHTLKTGTRTA